MWEKEKLKKWLICLINEKGLEIVVFGMDDG